MGVIRRIAKTAATVAALPILIPAYAVGGAIWNRLLEGQLRRSEAETRRLRRELSDARANLARCQETAETMRANAVERIADLERALAADKPLPVATPDDGPPTGPLPCIVRGCQKLSRPLTETCEDHGRPLPNQQVIGGPFNIEPPPKHYPDCALTQQWAGIVEKLTQEKRELKAHCDRLQAMVDEDNHRLEAATRERETLRRELADADRDHDAALAEVRARHREVLAERDETIARLQKKWEALAAGRIGRWLESKP